MLANHRASKSVIAVRVFPNNRDCELVVGFHEPLSSKITADLSVFAGDT